MKKIKIMFPLLLLIGTMISFTGTSSNQQKRILLITGDDYPGHKWKITAPVLADAIGAHASLHVDIEEDPNLLELTEFQKYDGIVMHFMNHQKPALGPEARKNLKKFVRKGGGLVIVHFACGAFTKWDTSGQKMKALGSDWPEFEKLAGRYWNPELRGHDPWGPFKVRINNSAHPVTAGIDDFTTTDELYTCLEGKTEVDTLAVATSIVDGRDHLMVFTVNYGRGKVFHSPLGHSVEAFNTEVCKLFRQGCAWTVGLIP